MQQHRRKYFSRRPLSPSTLEGWGHVKIQLLSEHGHVGYQIKCNHEMQQHGSKYFARRPLSTPDPVVEVLRQNSTFS